MPRMSNVKERRHQPLFDHLVRTSGATASVAVTTSLFQQSTTLGQPQLTNINAAGQLASDQTFLVLALRARVFFDGANARTLYQGISDQLYFTFVCGDKQQFQAPCWYTPAGGGNYGQAGLQAYPALAAGAQAAVAAIQGTWNNGMPTQEATMKLGRSIAIPVRQSFKVDATFFATGSSDVRSTINSGDATDVKIIAYYLDGLQTREVQ